MPVCRHSRYAGMDYVNHWIPACAGMTEEAGGLVFDRHDKGAVGMATHLFSPGRQYSLPVAGRRKLACIL